MIVNSRHKLSECHAEIDAAFAEHPHLEVKIKSSKRRSTDANALSWEWYGQISRELGEETIEQVHNRAKLELGVPILRAEDAGFRELYDRTLKPLSYEDKRALMAYIPVTSIMSRAQMGQFLDDMQRTYAERGVILESLEAA